MSSLGVRSLGMCSPINYFVTADAQISIFGGRSSLHPEIDMFSAEDEHRGHRYRRPTTHVFRGPLLRYCLCQKCKARNGRARLCLTKQAREE